MVTRGEQPSGRNLGRSVPPLCRKTDQMRGEGDREPGVTPMHGLTRRGLLATLPCLGGAGAARASEAAPYPSAPIALVVPFSAGGASDIAARLLARHAPRHLPNPDAQLVVENRP